MHSQVATRAYLLRPAIGGNARTGHSCVRAGAARTKDRGPGGPARLAAAQHLNLEPADFDATLFAVASGPAQQSEGLFSVISAIVGFMFALDAMLLTVPERRRMIEAMRRRGATRLEDSPSARVRRARARSCWRASSVCCSASCCRSESFHSQPGYLSFAFPVGSQREVTWLTVVEAVGAGMLAAFVGVLAPVRDILARPLALARHNRTRSSRLERFPYRRRRSLLGANNAHSGVPAAIGRPREHSR